MTQSAPALARILEMFAPGSICQNPIAGRLPSAKTCLRRFDLSILESILFMVVDERVV
jgi:hypothetical protein